MASSYVRVPMWAILLLVGLYFSGSPLIPTTFRRMWTKLPVRSNVKGVSHKSAVHEASAFSARDSLRNVVAGIDRSVCDSRNPNSLRLTREQRNYLASQRWFIAITLRNNNALLNHYLHELLVAIHVLHGGEFPGAVDSTHTSSPSGVRGAHNRSPLFSNVYVSIFESNSADSTPAYLTMFDDVLAVAGVPHTLLHTIELERLKNAGGIDALLRHAQQGTGFGRRAQAGPATASASAGSIVGSDDGYEGLVELRDEGRVLIRIGGSGGSERVPGETGPLEGEVEAEVEEEEVGGRLAHLMRRLGSKEEEEGAIDSVIFNTGGEKWSGNRIVFLARVRNWVMKPLYDNAEAWRARGGEAGKGGKLDRRGTGAWANSSGGGSRGRTQEKDKEEEEDNEEPSDPSIAPFTRVLFINDVWHCAEDIIRLALHTARADAACGMDFDTTSSYNTGFYDMWVARDIHGSEFVKGQPFVKRQSDRDILRAGKPLPVFCCWNGAVAAVAHPFYIGASADVPKGTPAGPVRFRRGRPGECAASECSLWCKDMWGSGAPRFLMDPSVRLAYELSTWRLLGREGVPWLTAEARDREGEGRVDDWPFTGEFPLHPPGRVSCCGLNGVGREPDAGCINEPLLLPGRREELAAMGAQVS